MLANVRLQERCFVAVCLGSIYTEEWDVFTALNHDNIVSVWCQNTVSNLFNNPVSLPCTEPGRDSPGISWTAGCCAKSCCNVTSNAKNAKKKNTYIFLSSSTQAAHNLAMVWAILVLFCIFMSKWVFSVPPYYLMRSSVLCWNFRPVFGFPKQLRPGPQSAV